MLTIYLVNFQAGPDGLQGGGDEVRVIYTTSDVYIQFIHASSCGTHGMYTTCLTLRMLCFAGQWWGETCARGVTAWRRGITATDFQLLVVVE